MSGAIEQVVVSTRSPLLTAGLVAALRDAGVDAHRPDDPDASGDVWVVDAVAAPRAAKTGAPVIMLRDADDPVDGVRVSMDDGLDVLLAALDAGEAGRWRPATAADSLLDELTERELDIVARVAHGATNQMVATELAISPNTVRTHLQNIMAKVGVSNRRELAAIYLGGDE